MKLNFDGVFFVELEFVVFREDLELVGHLVCADFIGGIEVYVLNVRTDVKVPGSGDATQAMNWLVGLDGAD